MNTFSIAVILVEVGQGVGVCTALKTLNITMLDSTNPRQILMEPSIDAFSKEHLCRSSQKKCVTINLKTLEGELNPLSVTAN